MEALRVVTGLILLTTLVSCGNSTSTTAQQVGQPGAQRTVQTADGSITIPGEAYLDGTDVPAKLTVMNVNVWDSVDKARRVCRIAHAASVQVLDSTRSEQEDMEYFLIESGNCRGWVSEARLSNEPKDVFGSMRSSCPNC